MNLSHIKESRRSLALLGVSERIESINKRIWVDCPQCSRVERVIENMLNADGLSPAPCLLVCGEGGAGKTSIINRIKKKQSSLEELIAFTTLSESPDGLRFRDLLLMALGVPFREQGRSKIPNGLEKYLQLRRFSAIVIDEFHEALLVQRGEQRRNLSMLKTLSGAPYHLRVMGFGIPSALNALQQDPQLERRFEVLKILPWEEGDEFRSFLASVEENLPLRKASCLYSQEIVKYLLSNTNGTMDQVLKVIRFGAIHAIINGEEKITVESMKLGAIRRWDY
ncbi:MULTISPECIES: TniB family NTP-binding protein [unclassified Pseudomonas]|uniref:TniB family NTP-binding protein n=1 Tax=unclassified Pseudomonas TaxID=196821 RepID=UPI000A1F15F8|nr:MULTISPECIES: TniB family NTP-binding protein [unclassified Pseudomonas]